MERLRGKIARVIKAKGFGFVVGDDGQERFLHVTDFLDQNDWEEVREGTVLTFTHLDTPKGGRCGEVSFAD